MKSEIAGIELSLWCVEKDVVCPLIDTTLGLRCNYFHEEDSNENKTLQRDTRVHRDGSPMRLKECMQADLEREDKDENLKDFHFDPEEFAEEEIVAIEEGIGTEGDVIE